MTLGIGGQQEAGVVDLHAFADAGDDIGKRSSLRGVHENVVGRQQRDVRLARKRDAGGERAAHMGTIGHRSGEPETVAENLAEAAYEEGVALDIARRGVGARHDRDAQAFRVIKKIVEIEKAFALLGPEIAGRQQTREPPVTGAILRIGENIRRAVGKDEPRARRDAQGADVLFVLARKNMGAHHTGERIAVGDADSMKLERAAVATNSSGCDAPRRNEKFVVVASSAKRGLRRIMGAPFSSDTAGYPHPSPLPQAGEGACSARYRRRGLSSAGGDPLLPLAGEGGREAAG